jgi:hypothetical protein
VVIGLPGGFMEAARSLGQRRVGRSPADLRSDPTSIS